MPEVAKPLLAVRAVILEGDRTLLLQRALDDKKHPGLWEFPGGKIDEGEELEAGLIREVREETGLTVELVSSMAHYGSEVIDQGRYKGRLYLALFCIARAVNGDLSISKEHASAEWMKPYDADKYDLTPESKLALASLRHEGLM